MGDLDINEVYDPTGITVCQARSLYEWLRVNDNLYNRFEAFYELIKQTPILEWDRKFGFGWILIKSKPTAKIQDMFENSPEEQLAFHRAKVKRLEKELEPNPGDVCRFWNDRSDLFTFGVLLGFDDSRIPFESAAGAWYKHAEKVTDPEIIKYFKK